MCYVSNSANGLGRNKCSKTKVPMSAQGYYDSITKKKCLKIRGFSPECVSTLSLEYLGSGRKQSIL